LGFESLRGSQEQPSAPADPAPTLGGRSDSRAPPQPAGPDSAAPPLPALLPLRQILRALDPAGPPEAILVCGEGVSGARGLVALAGSFNPPHLAHLALLRSALESTGAGGASAGVFVLSARTVDKEQPSGLLLEDRLWLLCRLASELSAAVAPRIGVVATNRGLYVDQATALRRLAPGVERIDFVTGHDKIVQILDPRYYDDREAALRRLFEQAAFLVAPRDEHSGADLDTLLGRPQNAPYAGRIRPLALDPRLARLSSTAVRGAALEGDGLQGLVPPAVERLLGATGAYAAPDGEGAYGRRAAALDALSGPAPLAAAAAPPGQRRSGS
jgi:nicotinamide-nucleotide adenylyltransferase